MQTNLLKYSPTAETPQIDTSVKKVEFLNSA